MGCLLEFYKSLNHYITRKCVSKSYNFLSKVSFSPEHSTLEGAEVFGTFFCQFTEPICG
jgi:hypothetical protein